MEQRMKLIVNTNIYKSLKLIQNSREWLGKLLAFALLLYYTASFTRVLHIWRPFCERHFLCEMQVKRVIRMLKGGGTQRTVPGWAFFNFVNYGVNTTCPTSRMLDQLNTNLSRLLWKHREWFVWSEKFHCAMFPIRKTTINLLSTILIYLSLAISF